MKHQSHADRMHERHGEMKHHLHQEADRHMERIHMEKSMHEHHSKDMYRHEEEKPHIPKSGHMLHGQGLNEAKIEAMPIAYGQAGVQGMNSDMKKIHSQHKDYNWDGQGNTGY